MKKGTANIVNYIVKFIVALVKAILNRSVKCEEKESAKKQVVVNDFVSRRNARVERVRERSTKDSKGSSNSATSPSVRVK